MTSGSGSIVAEFLNYNCWANLRLIDACLRLTPEELDSSAPGVYGTIYDTLKHLIRSESRYYHRLTGGAPEAPFAWEANPSLADMRAYAEQVGRAFTEAADRAQPADTLPRDWYDNDWQGYPERYRAMGLLIQALNHAIEHRTNITTILAQRGIQPPDLDGWEYMRANPNRMGA